MDLIRLLLSSSWKILILAAIVSLLSGVTTTGIIAVINNTQVNSSTLNASLIWGFVGLCLFRFISSVISQTLLISLSQKAILNLRMLLSQRILASPFYHIENLGNNRILATLTDDVQSISNTALILPRVCVNIVIVISCLLYLCWLSPTLFLILVLFIVIGITSYQLTANKATTFLLRGREQQDKLFSYFRGITDGTKELMLHYKKRETFFKDLQATAESYEHENVVGMSIFALAASWAQIMFFVAIGIVIFILPALKNTQNQVLSGYVLTITYLIVPLDAIINSLSTFSKAFVALDKIKSLDLKLTTPAKEIGFEDNLKLLTSAQETEEDNLKLLTSAQETEEDNLKLLTPELENKEDNLKLLTFGQESREDNSLIFSDSELICQRLEFLDVTYKYQSEDKYLFTVGPLNLTFSAGEIVFLIGGNGSGKSTFIKLLTGLYIPDTGKIIINGKLITAEEREWYRQHFSVVFFDFYLFDNLLNSGKTISDDQIYDYLVKLQLNNKVKVKNGVLSTTALSQGQRKRLALLTAYLEDRAIYVFDEWASDQDPIFKNIFYTQILPDLKSQGKLVIAVTHDDQYYHLSDRIIKLNNGIVEYDKLQQQPL